MRITENKLRMIIREELDQFKPASSTVSPEASIRRIIKICEEALMNKSFGFKENVTQDYADLLEYEVGCLKRGCE